MCAASELPASNPFSTRFVRPGALPYQFPPSLNTDDVVARLRQNGWQGQIVGPHGSGKSTLLANLREPLLRVGFPAFTFSLRDGQRRLPLDWRKQVARAGARLVIVDGCEQLSWWSRALLKWHCRRHGWGLLITSHRDLRLPTLLSTGTSVEMAQNLAAALLPADDRRITPQMVAESFRAAGGDMRETLFALYDRYEATTSDRSPQ